MDREVHGGTFAPTAPDGGMVVAIVGGTGREGYGLALRLGCSGHLVVIGSREPTRAVATALKANERLSAQRISGASNEEAIDASEIVFLTVPFHAQRETLHRLGQRLIGKILVDVTVPLSPDKMGVVCLPPEGSAARIAQEVLGDGVRLVSAFQNVSARSLMKLGEGIDSDVLVCGDDPSARQAVVRLAKTMGMRAWNAGPLANAAAAEALTSALIAVCGNHGLSDVGIQIVGSACGKKQGGCRPSD